MDHLHDHPAMRRALLAAAVIALFAWLVWPTPVETVDEADARYHDAEAATLVAESLHAAGRITLDSLEAVREAEDRAGRGLYNASQRRDPR